MKNMIKKTIFLIAFLSAASLSFADNYLDFGMVLGGLNDRFPDDAYKRSQIGFHGNFAYYFFPSASDFGLFAQIAVGGSSPQSEEIPRESMSARKASIFDLRTVAAPSYRLQLGVKAFFYASLGPIFIFTYENSTEKLVSGSTEYNYQSLSGGIQGNFSFAFVFFSGFVIRTGISLDSLFLRAEKGEMRMNYRTTHNDHFKGARYYTFGFDLFFCLGFKF